MNWGRILEMFNKIKNIFEKNNKRLKSVLASVLLGVGCTGVSFAKPRSISSSTEKQEIGGNKDSVNTYDVMQIVNMMNDNKKEVGESLALFIASIFGYKKFEPMVRAYRVRKFIATASDEEIKAALDKIRNVDKVSNKVLNIADNIIEKYLKIAKRKKIVNDATKDKQIAFNKANEKRVDFDKKDDKNTKEFFSYIESVSKKKEQALSKLQLSADEWFTKLGGTKKDIDGYKEPDLGKINKKVEEQIEKDIPRTFVDEFRVTNYDQKLTLLSGILKKFEIEEFQGGYTQGYNVIAGLVIIKFTEGDKKMGEGEKFSKEKKAKIYYVYKTIVQTIANYSVGKNGIDCRNYCQILDSLYLKMLLSFCKRNNVDEIDKNVFFNNCGCAVTRIVFLCCLKTESQIFLWDSIISEVKDGKFDPNLALEKIFDMWFARALLSHKDLLNDTNFEDLSAVGLDNFMTNNNLI